MYTGLKRQYRPEQVALAGLGWAPWIADAMRKAGVPDRVIQQTGKINTAVTQAGKKHTDVMREAILPSNLTKEEQAKRLATKRRLEVEDIAQAKADDAAAAQAPESFGPIDVPGYDPAPEIKAGVDPKWLIAGGIGLAALAATVAFALD